MKSPDLNYEISGFHISAIQIQRFQRGRTLGGTSGEGAGAAGAAGGRTLPAWTLTARRGVRHTASECLSARGLRCPLTRAAAGDCAALPRLRHLSQSAQVQPVR
jgi:hypothetical protein